MARLSDLATGDRLSIRWCERLYNDVTVVKAYRNGQVKVMVHCDEPRIDAAIVISRADILARLARA